MKLPKSRIVILFPLIFAACFPSRRAIFIKADGMTMDTTIPSPTKVFLYDASVVLFPEGFSINNRFIFGSGQRYWLDRNDLPAARKIPLDSVASMTYYELYHTGGEQFGSLLLAAYGGLMTPMSIYCLSCPKCCFGSCPTVYTYDGDRATFEAELFSYSVSKCRQGTDLDRLCRKIPEAGPYRIRVTNEALETHFIDRLSLVAVRHPLGTEMLPSDQGDFVVLRKLEPPSEAVNSAGDNVLSFVVRKDDLSYRSGQRLFESRLETRNHDIRRDWITLKMKPPKEKGRLKLALRLRNTLLTTILFYDVVLASQGVRAIEWTEKMNTDPSYAFQFYQVYRMYSGVQVGILRDGIWTRRTVIEDPGPIGWKDVAVQIPVEKNDFGPDGTVAVWLEFFPDNFMIDYAAFEFDPAERGGDLYSAAEIQPTEIRDHAGGRKDEILALIQKEDSRFLVTNPGDSYVLDYDLKDAQGLETSVFIRSKGYYTEWIRGNWLTTPNAGYHFNLFEVDKTVAQLRRSWLENRDLLEKEFFRTRIPLRGKL